MQLLQPKLVGRSFFFFCNCLRRNQWNSINSMIYKLSALLRSSLSHFTVSQMLSINASDNIMRVKIKKQGKKYLEILLTIFKYHYFCIRDHILSQSFPKRNQAFFFFFWFLLFIRLFKSLAPDIKGRRLEPWYSVLFI